MLDNYKFSTMASCWRIDGIILIFILSLGLWSCEDVIQVELEDGGEALVVDAWLNTLEVDQEILLSAAQTYFDGSAPQGIVSAEVLLRRNDGAIFTFLHDEGGKYIWPYASGGLGEVGDSFQLEINYDGQSFQGQSELRRVPQIDSIGIEFREDELFFDDGLYAQFFARDFIGGGDTYWIRTYKNGDFLSKTQSINLAFDAGFDAGTGVDGLIFIPPIRELINELDEDLLQVPYEVGDEIRVEIHSISNEAFDFMEIARDQINNGDNGIFSIPLANTRTNISSTGGLPVLGFFNMAAVSTRTRIVE